MQLGAATSMVAALSVQAAALRIDESRSDVRLACVELVDLKFALSFIHSVSLTPVHDQYRLLNDDQGGYRILQTEERFYAHGQGLPSMYGEPDAIAFEHRNGQFILRLKRPINNLIVRTDSRYKNRLHTGQITINLNQWPDTGLRIYPTDRCE
ncbi:MAG: DUF1850 domain-containing protein [Magnetovibrio sp.]|nr:DUF1850 domain-containing protein [Magnetovibrio sp.]